MKRLLVIFVVLGITLNVVYAENIDKSQYKEVSLTEYKAAGVVKDREDTEKFKLTLKFLLQAANSVALQDGENLLQRFNCEEKLSFTKGQEVTLYVHSVHTLEGVWLEEVIDLIEAAH
ncbi:hypothetical protein LQZ19_13135 [Treponema primitia]|uniref:hypothetical protein n=1 Tax=Treponema primitia TaxID=88058 RepID=UPI003980F583